MTRNPSRAYIAFIVLLGVALAPFPSVGDETSQFDFKTSVDPLGFPGHIRLPPSPTKPDNDTQRVMEILKLAGHSVGLFGDGIAVGLHSRPSNLDVAIMKDVRINALTLDGDAAADSVLPKLPIMNLSVLRVNGKQLSDDGTVEIKGLRSLVYIDVSGTSVGDASLSRFATLSNLRHLDVSETNISPAGVSALVKTNLRFLDFAGTNVDDTAIPFLLKIKSLDTLGWEGSKISASGAISLEQRLRLRFRLIRVQMNIP